VGGIYGRIKKRTNIKKRKVLDGVNVQVSTGPFLKAKLWNRDKRGKTNGRLRTGDI